MQSDIYISEVGPRDGLQNIKAIMPTVAKKAWISADAACGVPEIEVGSFVPPKLVPQLADTAEIVAFARGIEGLTVAALIPNLRGAMDAIQAGAHKIILPFSVSETHSIRNLNRSHEQMFREATLIVEKINTLPIDSRPRFEVGLATAFGCSIEGNIPEKFIVEMAEKFMKIGCDEIGLSDTTGYANPVQIKKLVRAVKNAIGKDGLTGVHLHNTRGLGLANVCAALDAGITTIDSSLCGLGGCPTAPGASGNIVTEDLVFMLEAMGCNTGIDLERLLHVRNILKEALPDENLYGYLSDAGGGDI